METHPGRHRDRRFRDIKKFISSRHQFPPPEGFVAKPIDREEILGRLSVRFSQKETFLWDSIFCPICASLFSSLASARLLYRQMTLPVHVRWEIYPVQHETAAKVAYGGSYLEEIDWWEKKREHRC